MLWLVPHELTARLRAYWYEIPLPLAAIVLLVLAAVVSAPASTAMVGAGSALAGAAAARVIDLGRERRAEARQAGKERRDDLDETLRLSLMMIAAKGARTFELAATIANAIAQHQRAARPDEAIRHLMAIADNGPGADESVNWLRGRIERITAELNST